MGLTRCYKTEVFFTFIQSDNHIATVSNSQCNLLLAKYYYCQWYYNVLTCCQSTTLLLV